LITYPVIQEKGNKNLGKINYHGQIIDPLVVKIEDIKKAIFVQDFWKAAQNENKKKEDVDLNDKEIIEKYYEKGFTGQQA